MTNRQPIVYIVLLCLVIGSQSLFLDKIKSAVKQTKCKLHNIGNSIIAHDHKHGDPCGHEEILNNNNRNDFGIQNGYLPNQNSNYNQNSYNQGSYGQEYAPEKDALVPHEEHTHTNGHSYGGDIIQNNYPSSPEDKYLQGSDLNNSNNHKYEEVSNHLEKLGNESQTEKYQKIASANEKDQINIKIVNKDVPEDPNNRQEHLEKNKDVDKKDLNLKAKPEKKPANIPQKSKHKKYNSDYVSNEDSEEYSKEEEATTTPRIDLRAGGIELSSTFAPVPKSGGKNIASAKCNTGVLTGGDNTCREEI